MTSIARPLTLRTTGPEETRALAAAIAEACTPGDAIALTGELGAGKTCFVQGAATALGVERQVVSPTFTIVRSYAGRLPIVHVDVYRLDAVQDFVELGEEDVLGEDHVTFIEWGDMVTMLLPDDRLEVELLLGDGAETERVVQLRGLGSWASRLVELLPSLEAWAPDDRRKT